MTYLYTGPNTDSRYTNGFNPLWSQPKETAGALSLKAEADNTKYDGEEVARAQMWDVMEQARECGLRYEDVYDENSYYVVMLRASDPLLSNLVRQKFYAYLYMPSPRPEQAVWLYKKSDQSLQYLWSLPPAKLMAAISEATDIAPKWRSTKIWVDAFYKLKFWECIREQHGDHHISELEYLNANREEIKKASGNLIDPSSSEPFDFSKIITGKVVDTSEALAN